MADNVLLNKAAIIERCLKRIKEEYQNNPDNLNKNYTKQDSILLNLERACEASIDIAMRLVRKYQLGLPQESRDAFKLLAEAKKISTELANELQAMVGFRNIAVHEYQELNLEIVESILNNRLVDFTEWAKIAIAEAKD
jgi:uncharacterized protein YutE (UPF0331/DUF86 family)